MYNHLIISLTTNTSLNFYKKAWSTLNTHISDPDWVSNLDALTIQFKSKSRVQVNFKICNKRSGTIMFKYPPTVEEINQTTTLNQPFQIEFTVLLAKSDSESNLQDRIKTASSNVRCTVAYKLMFNIVLALYYIYLATVNNI